MMMMTTTTTKMCRRTTRLLLQPRRFFSSTVHSQPLLFLLGGGDRPSPKILIPDHVRSSNTMIGTSSLDTIYSTIQDHYTSDTLDVGGMGEQDEGVWFAAGSDTDQSTSAYGDVFDHYATLIQETTAMVKTERHGVPFGVCTSGVLKDSSVDLRSLGLSVINVSLFAGSPSDYETATGCNHFGQVCGFVVDAVEQGLPVEVSVLSEFASAGRDLGHSLGARHVHVVQSKDS